MNGRILCKAFEKFDKTKAGKTNKLTLIIINECELCAHVLYKNV